MKEKFIKFLEENKALDLFKTNLSKKNKDFDYFINQQYKNGSKLIDHAFTWSGTPQGHKFWSDLHTQWATFYRENFINKQ